MKSKSLRVILRLVLLYVSRLVPEIFLLVVEWKRRGRVQGAVGGPDPGLSSADLQANVQ